MTNTKQLQSNQTEDQDEDNKPFFRETQSYNLFEKEYTKGAPLTQDQFLRLKKKVFEYRPNIAHMVQNFGKKSFYEFAKNQFKENRNKIIRERKIELIASVKDEVKKRLGDVIAESVAKQLKENSSISTIYPFAPIGHPYVITSALQDALAGFDSNNPNLKNIIVLSCADISFNNLRFPRGHLFHTFQKDTISLDMFTFFGHTVDSQPVIFHSPYGAQGVEEMQKDVQTLRQTGKINKKIYQKLLDIIDDIYASPHALSANNFNDQLTITNFWLWKRMFRGYKNQMPNMIFLAQEEIVLRLLVDHHLYKDTTIHNILFDAKYETLLAKHFKGIMGSFSKEENYGTFLFWALPKQGKYRIQLWKEGNYLVSHDKTFKVELTPEGIQKAIENQELIPSLLLTFLVLAFYYGLFLGGGVDQTLYLEQMKQAFIAMQKEYGDTESIEACNDTITSHFLISRPAFAFLEAPNKDRVPATGLDLLLYENQSSWKQVYDATKTITVEEIMDRILPSFYKEYTPPNEKEADLLGITPRDIGLYTGLDKKMPFWTTINPEEQ